MLKNCRPKCVLLLLVFSAITAADEVKPKYGPQAIPLSTSHEYFKGHDAPDFWALMPYYIPQRDDQSCSLAVASMVVNAARVGVKLSSEDELATQEGVSEKTSDDLWKKGVGPGGEGVTLDELGRVIEESLKAYGIKNFTIDVIHANDQSKETQDQLHRALIRNEKSAKDLILINAIQGVFTGDAQVGHIAPIGAYDESSRRVLILDPDRQWYEPYWVSEETLLKGMATKDEVSQKNRGYVWVHLDARQKSGMISEPRP